MTKCKNCGADKGLHDSMTDQCPVGVESLYHPMPARGYLVDGNNTVEHLTIRQHFAGLAMQGFSANPEILAWYRDQTDVNAPIAEWSARAADDLIEALNKTNE